MEMVIQQFHEVLHGMEVKVVITAIGISICLSLWEYRKILHIEYISNYTTHQKYLSSSDTRFKSTIFINYNRVENFDGFSKHCDCK
jgi:hypothetical protein